MRSTRFWTARRMVWRVRRSVPRLARPLSALVSAAPPARPILLLGCPRAGTSLLFQALLRAPGLGSVHSEGHILWDEFHHPKDRGWESDALGAEDVTDRERAYVYTAVRLFARGRRFLDKTPESCLRIPYLRALFPDAHFVFLRRRAADTVNSLIEGWRARPRFVKYRLAEPLEGLGPLSGPSWSFVLVPGWRELRHASLEEVTARQYVACNEAVLAARSTISAGQWTDVAYEELLADPVGELERVFTCLQIEFGPDAQRFAETLRRRPSKTALTAPRPEKWRRQNRNAVERILPLVRPTEARLGYS